MGQEEFWDRIIFDTKNIKFSALDNPKFVPLEFDEIVYISYSYVKTIINQTENRITFGYILLMEISYHNEKNSKQFSIYETPDEKEIKNVYEDILTFNIHNYSVRLHKQHKRKFNPYAYAIVCGIPLIGIILIIIRMYLLY